MKITKRDLREIIAEQLKEAAQVIDDIPREGDDADMGYDPIADMLGVPQGDAEDYAAAAGLPLTAKFTPENQDKMVIAYLKKNRRLNEPGRNRSCVTRTGRRFRH